MAIMMRITQTEPRALRAISARRLNTGKKNQSSTVALTFKEEKKEIQVMT